MAELVLFHHVQGLTEGVVAFADRIREAGHTVHVPDLFGGRTFATIEDGIAFAKEVGFDTITERGTSAVEGLSSALVYGGFSMGVMPAQTLVQTRAGAKGGLFYHGTIPPEFLDGAWPEGTPVQAHFMKDDPWSDEDIPAAQALAEAHEGVEVFLYEGSGHLFADSSVADYDEAAADLLVERTLAFLEGLD